MEQLFAFCSFNGRRKKKLEKMYQELNEDEVDIKKWKKYGRKHVSLIAINSNFWGSSSSLDQLE
jgi:hypothetical protein